jgi:predicted membrane-bound spermidine synthase
MISPLNFSRFKSEYVLTLSFFLSGAAALIYQLCWNRALYAAVGVDMDSVTIIVSCFMLGIGIGGALGGWLSDKYPGHKSKIYALTEAALCAYGLLSIVIIGAVTHWTLLPGVFGLLITVVVVFLVLLIPTVLMGMTLPVLSLVFQGKTGNMGGSVGRLYFANTLGAATGAYVVPHHLFQTLDLQQTCFLAAAINAAVACMTMLALKLEGSPKRVAAS